MARDPAVDRVIQVLERAERTARDARDALVGWDNQIDMDAAHAAWKVARDDWTDAWEDLAAARNATTLADLLASDRPAVRAATVLALKPTPPASRRKR
jgi:hypothetical protein